MNADTFNAAQEAIATAAQHAHKGMPGSAALCLQDARLAPGTRVTYGKWDGVIVRHEFDSLYIVALPGGRACIGESALVIASGET